MKIEIETTEEQFERLKQDMADIIFTLAWFGQVDMAKQAIHIASKIESAGSIKKTKSL
ncbi:MAG: hypothetical protein WCH99_00260 [Verrucomicrobiota bacterium]